MRRSFTESTDFRNEATEKAKTNGENNQPRIAGPAPRAVRGGPAFGRPQDPSRQIRRSFTESTDFRNEATEKAKTNGENNQPRIAGPAPRAVRGGPAFGPPHD